MEQDIQTFREYFAKSMPQLRVTVDYWKNRGLSENDAFFVALSPGMINFTRDFPDEANKVCNEFGFRLKYTDLYGIAVTLC